MPHFKLNFNYLIRGFFVFAYLVIGQASFLLAQTIAPKYSNEFLKIGVGARAFAMGGGMTAIAEDVTAGYWNPAGLIALPRNYEVSVMHSEYFASIAKYDYAGFSAKIDSVSRIGFTFIRLGVDDIPNTLNFKEGNTFNYSNITSKCVISSVVASRLTLFLFKILYPTPNLTDGNVSSTLFCGIVFPVAINACEKVSVL